MKKEKGSVEYSFCIMLLIIGMLMLAYVMNMKIISHTKILVDDGITGANLASAVIDMKGDDGYLNTGEIKNYDYKQMYELYLEALKGSLGLDDSMVPQNHVLLKSPVKILEYIVYNIEDNDVIEKRIVTNGGSPDYSDANVTIHTNGKDTYQTPDGTVIRTMTIYSKIEFDVEKFGQVQTVTKEHSVDVTPNLIETGGD